MMVYKGFEVDYTNKTLKVKVSKDGNGSVDLNDLRKFIKDEIKREEVTEQRDKSIDEILQEDA